MKRENNQKFSVYLHLTLQTVRFQIKYTFKRAGPGRISFTVIFAFVLLTTVSTVTQNQLES